MSSGNSSQGQWGRFARTGASAGLGWGFLTGLLVCYLEYPFPNYTLVGNEILVEFFRRYVSTSIARAVDTPFNLMGLYILGGLALGTLIGALAGTVATLLGRTPGPRLRWTIAVAVMGGLLLSGYFALGLMHYRLPGGITLSLLTVLVLFAFLITTAVALILSRFLSNQDRAFHGAILPAFALLLVLIEVVSVWQNHSSRGVNATGAPSGGGSKVVIFCLDGLGWGVLAPLLRAGELPAIASLMESGSSGILRSTLPPIKSPLVWTSVATCRLPKDHKVFDFLSYSKEKGRWMTTTNRVRKKPTFWEILTELDVPVDVLSWYPSWPPDSIRGLMLTDRATYTAAIPERVYPEEYSPFLDSLLEDIKPRIDLLRTRFTSYNPELDEDASSEDPEKDLRKSAIQILDQTYIRDRVTLAFALRRIREGRGDVMAIYFRGTDSMQHKFRKYHAAEHDPLLASLLYNVSDWEREKLGSVIDEYIRFVDECIGTILEQLDPFTTVMVLSDHDSGYRYDRQLIVRAPNLFDYLGWMKWEDGELDLSQTRIYGVRDPSEADVFRFFANLKGREGHGIISEAELPTLLESAEETLRSLKTVAGTPLLLDVKRGAGTGTGASEGDLLGRINPAALGGMLPMPDGATMPVSKIASYSPKSGNHRITGVLILSGNKIVPGKRIRGATIYDIIPTVFHLLGLPLASDWEGSPILSAMERKFRRENPVRWVTSYEGMGFSEGGSLPDSEGANDAIREELRSLGYIQ